MHIDVPGLVLQRHSPTFSKFDCRGTPWMFGLTPASPLQRGRGVAFPSPDQRREAASRSAFSMLL